MQVRRNKIKEMVRALLYKIYKIYDSRCFLTNLESEFDDE
jgi:hypothetical protein